MTLLLDAHAWIWHYFGNSRMRAVARAAIDDPAFDPYGVARLW